MKVAIAFKNPITDWFLIRARFSINRKVDPHFIDFINSALLSDFQDWALIGDIFDKVLPKLLSDKEKDLTLNLISNLFSINQSINMPVLSDYWIEKFNKVFNKSVIELCSEDIIDLFIKKIKDICSTDHSLDYLEVTTIRDHRMNSVYKGYNTLIVFTLRDFLLNANNALIEKKINELLEDEKLIFTRLALHTIDQRYDELSTIFRSWIQSNKKFIEQLHYRHELYELLVNHSKYFDTTIINLIINKIEEYNPYDEEGISMKLAYKRKELLNSLLPSGKTKVSQLYDKYNSINSLELEHPGFLCWHETFSGTRSPLSRKDLEIKIKDDSISNYLNNFKATGKFQDGDERGLADQIQIIAEENSLFISDHLEKLLSIPRSYIPPLILGLKYAIQKNKFIPINNFLDYICAIFTSDNFFESNADDSNYLYLTIGYTSELIIDLLKDKREYLDENSIKLVQRIFGIILENFNLIIANYKIEYPMYQFFSASLKLCNFIPTYWEKYKEEILPNNYFITQKPLLKAVGENLNILYNLDKNWFENNINNLFPNEQDLWETTFSSFLINGEKSNSELYNFLYECEFIHKASKTYFKEYIANEIMMQNIVDRYYLESQLGEESQTLMNIFISNINKNKLKILSKFILKYSPPLNQPLKTVELWNEIFQLKLLQDENIESENLKNIYCNLFFWIRFIAPQHFDNQTLKNLSKCIVFFDYPNLHLAEVLYPFTSHHPQLIANIYIKFAENNIFFGRYSNYKIDDFINSVEDIKNKGAIDEVKRLSKMYLNEGITFLNKFIDQ